ncbi:MAG: DNA polymerase I [Clostridia bacterium]|nr:DNA polymerase I [Clostridia bacterium]
MEKLVLIDGNSLINRAFYAMPVLSTQDGKYTNAVYGFLNMFIKMLSDVKPTFVAVAFDVKAPTFRHEMFTEYKGTRKPMPEELRPQIPLLKEVLTKMGVYITEKAGIEADDIIGTIAKATDVETFIYTGDKDSFQLVDENTTVYFTRRGITDIEEYNHKNFTEKTGITPKQIIDLKSLMGDSSDNIPGIAGIGEKTAKTLIQTYGSLNEIYAHTLELKGKLKEKIENGKDSAYLSYKLATINTECEIEVDLEKMRISTPFSQEVKQFFTELEFKSIVKRQELFENTDKTEIKEEKTEELLTCNLVLVEDLESFNLNNLSKNLSIVLLENQVCVYDILSNTEYIIKLCQNIFDEGVLPAVCFNKIKNLFAKEYNLVLYNAKSIKHYLLNNFDIELKANYQDLSLLKYLVDFAGEDEDLEKVLYRNELAERPKAFAQRVLFNRLYNKADEKEKSIYKEIELPLSDVLFEMEKAGFKVDEKSLSELGKEYESKLALLDKQIKEFAGIETLNVNSPKQLGEVLFEKLKVGKGKKTKTGYSTSYEVLESLYEAHPIIPLILEYRHLQKIYSTYIEGFKPLIDKKTGLIHTSFNQTTTATGRLSSKEPNLQNIPIRDEQGSKLRKFFVPRNEDRLIIGADYSQIELRLLAIFSNCKPLIDAFNNGKDIHSLTASKVFKVKLEEVTSKMRRHAKAVNFGIIYGMSEYGLSKSLKISVSEARDYINSYFKEYPEVKKYMDNNVFDARTNGYAVTLFGRKRVINEFNSPLHNVRQMGDRIAMNMPLQGSSADIIKVAMINVYNRLKKENLKSQLILSIHDELIIDAFEDERERIEEILVSEMQGVVDLSVKLTVEVGSGKNWLEAK